MADAMPQLAEVSDRPLGADLAHPRSEGVPAAPSRWRLGGQALLLALAYYAGAQIGFALQSPTEPHSVLWLPNSILLSVLLVTPPRQWPVYLLAAFPPQLLAPGNRIAQIAQFWVVEIHVTASLTIPSRM